MHEIAHVMRFQLLPYLSHFVCIFTMHAMSHMKWYSFKRTWWMSPNYAYHFVCGIASTYHRRATVAFSGQSQEKVGGAPHTCTSRLHDIIIIRLWAYFSFPSLPSKTRTLCGALPIRITSVCVHVVNVNARKLDSILFGTWLVGGFHIAFC